MLWLWREIYAISSPGAHGNRYIACTYEQEVYSKLVHYQMLWLCREALSSRDDGGDERETIERLVGHGRYVNRSVK